MHTIIVFFKVEFIYQMYILYIDYYLYDFRNLFYKCSILIYLMIYIIILTLLLQFIMQRYLIIALMMVNSLSNQITRV